MTGRWLIVGVTSLFVVGGGAFLFGIATSDSEDAVASLESLEDRGVIHLEDDHVFLVFNDGKPIALSDDAQHVGDRVEFCESSQMLESPAHGEKFDMWGLYYAGPAQRGWIATRCVSTAIASSGTSADRSRGPSEVTHERT